MVDSWMRMYYHLQVHFKKGVRMNLEELLKSLEAELTVAYDRYAELHKRLDTYRGQTLTDDTAKEVNVLLKEIQETFHIMWPVFNWILYRHQPTINAVNGYHLFVDSIQKGKDAQEESK